MHFSFVDVNENIVKTVFQLFVHEDGHDSFDLQKQNGLIKFLFYFRQTKTMDFQNDGCNLHFNNHQSKSCHLKSGDCVGTPPVVDTPDDTIKVVKHGNVFLCTNCNHTINHQNNISRHKKRCKGMKKPEFPCTECDKVFCYTSELERHIKQKHANPQPEKICGT